MGRLVARITRRTVCVLGATLLGALCLPALATAGTYTWNMPQNFTATSPGANPDHDNYGGHPWDYSAFSSSQTAQALQFSTSVDGGLSGWVNGNSFLAENTTSDSVGGVQPGQFAMRPSQGGTVELVWTSPISGNVSVSGSVDQVNPSAPCGFVWALSSGTSNGGPTIYANGADSGSISAPIPVQAGSYVQFYIQDTSTIYNPACDTAAVSLTLQAASTNPTVTVSSPTSGQTVTQQPTFTGSAGTSWGDSGTVALRVYSGFAATGEPVETLTPAVSGGSYSAATDPVLASGTYTVQAEQDDAAGDRGLSQAVTFAVHNVQPKVTLNYPGSPLRTASPTVTGTASTAAGDGTEVWLAVFAGTRATGKPVRFLTGTRSASGRFAFTVSPSLPDGIYTVVAAQRGVGSNGLSSPATFEVKVNAPALTFIEPADGGVAANTRPVFWGAAGTEPGDAALVKLRLYSGPLTIGKPRATVTARVADGTWVYTWPGTLPLGLYSAVAQQSDNAGHTTVSAVHTFLISVVPPVLGYVLDLTAHNEVTVTVDCPSGPVACTGDVLATTQTKLQPFPGGPKGSVRLLFVHVRIRAGKSTLVRRAVSARVAAALRRRRVVEVRLGAILSNGPGPAIKASGRRLLSVR